MTDFDYQWKNLPSKDIELNETRVKDFLSFTKIKPDKFIKDKYCLDAGCGSGRFSYAMQKLGAKRVDSIDLSQEAIAKCKNDVNPNAYVFNLMDLKPNPVYDFVLCWGVLNHVPDPRKGFSKVASQVKKKNSSEGNNAGMLHIMVYHKDTQKPYEEDRKKWRNLSLDQQLKLCEEKVQKMGGTVHGWFDALNPEYNWSYDEKEIKKWFEEEGFSKIKLVTKHNINMRGELR
jgi:SAM-dependent methyltransferase